MIEKLNFIAGYFESGQEPDLMLSSAIFDKIPARQAPWLKPFSKVFQINFNHFDLKCTALDKIVFKKTWT
jgi:hypothetical protein